MSTQTAAEGAPRVRVFVDYWNFQLSLNQREAQARGLGDYRFAVDWAGLGRKLAQLATSSVGVTDHSFEGVNIYASHDPNSGEGKKFKNWATTWLNRQPGVHVESRERRPRAAPRCPSCYYTIDSCPQCHRRMAGTVEKGVDTLIATDMIRLAWENAYDFAVLASSDADLVPAVEFLDSRARKVIQAGFPPLGVHLATSCWASFDVYQHRVSLQR